MPLILRAVDVNLGFDPGALFDEVREAQFEAYSAWQDDILRVIDGMWRGWVEETGRSRRGFATGFDPNEGRILIYNTARNTSGDLYAQYVHRAGRPKTDLYIDHVMRALLVGPVREMLEYLELELEEILRRNIAPPLARSSR